MCQAYLHTHRQTSLAMLSLPVDFTFLSSIMTLKICSTCYMTFKGTLSLTKY